MTLTEALERCRERQSDACERSVRWIAHQTTAGEWTLARCAFPGFLRLSASSVARSSRFREPQAPDPRPLLNPLWGQG